MLLQLCVFQWAHLIIERRLETAQMFQPTQYTNCINGYKYFTGTITWCTNQCSIPTITNCFTHVGTHDLMFRLHNIPTVTFTISHKVPSNWPQHTNCINYENLIMNTSLMVSLHCKQNSTYPWVRTMADHSCYPCRFILVFNTSDWPCLTSVSRIQTIPMFLLPKYEHVSTFWYHCCYADTSVVNYNILLWLLDVGALPECSDVILQGLGQSFFTWEALAGFLL